MLNLRSYNWLSYDLLNSRSDDWLSYYFWNSNLLILISIIKISINILTTYLSILISWETKLSIVVLSWYNLLISWNYRWILNLFLYWYSSYLLIISNIVLHYLFIFWTNKWLLILISYNKKLFKIIQFKIINK